MTRSPQRFSGRAGSHLPGRVRRALDAQVDTDRRLDSTLDVDRDGRMGIRLARDSGLEMTREGLKLSPSAKGEMNRPQMAHVRDLETTATAAEVLSKVNELLGELRRTKRLRG